MKVGVKFVSCCAIPALAVGLAACGKTTESAPAASPSATPTSSASAPQDTAPAATTADRPEVSPDAECAGSQFHIEQFVGSWQEPGESTVTTLAQHGSLSATGTGEIKNGTWKFTQVADTPAAAQVPVPTTCVLWFAWVDPTMDLFYVPLKVTTNHLELSYVGRGNTIEWDRVTAAN